MKKNLMTVVILALVFANFVMTAIMMFSVLPQTKKANEMITKVCEAIDLELNSGAAVGLSNLPISQIETYDVAAGEAMTINLKDGGYGQISVSISVNNESDVYAENEGGAYLSSKEAIIKDSINKIIGQYTKDEVQSNPELVQNEILKNLQKTFGADYVVDVSFPKCVVQ